MGRLSLLFLLFAVPALPQAPEAWVTTDFSFVTLGKFEIVGNAQFRSDPGLKGIAYARGGPILTFRPKQWLAATLGYWWQENEIELSDWNASQRIYGGVELRWFQRKGWTLQSRQFGERFFLGHGLTTNRYRQRVMVELPLRFRPSVGNEWVFDRFGLQYFRSTGSVRFRPTEHTELMVAYLYDVFRVGLRNRQAINTTIRFNKPWHR